ncbi:vacuolar protein sorting-associated protein 72 homolog [Daktulosphaira vitifoliae]|uniref:vacuolar protein sorting-associated protein 72 homolog n=1 Tax=Daktulosphaira vitifoliae TaxID=58002 RepID=UPI0021AAA8B3|nr:vacuolar protein sorting-associated protein 72 homolog [Daktulosphaira vitifoliae]XP_050542478.1 vacuolar protein sorting-associated protein 72 homolog [Daktulosphaira vitifoliae]XP_050542479.1 vacuolar protein sorting-associated protein 72 homolog [Daktulosphaira vitifoliae]XP_050542480.1 vacuolar protein sorting-associated protein 72 homolog [Daktulosphaira vitifoliae]XP_050542481.1 vacuolar protein sorting-associated protein 72 homolog [Daktulosphaira vitifoliae]XP_050542482.1 vacuolar p
MAATRERRANAGNKLARLLDEEEEDDFYKTTYGGFEEEEQDNDFQFVDDDAPDEVDSDFSIDENDEVISDNEDDEKPQKKINRYQEPKAPKPVLPKESLKRKRSRTEKVAETSYERKSIRQSTAVKSKETIERIKERRRKKKRAKPPTQEEMPTQQELLEEAKETELENLKSLEKFEKLELAKKQTRVKQHVFYTATIKFRSRAVPAQILDEETINIETDDQDVKRDNRDYVECTTLTVNDYEEAKRLFPTKLSVPPKPHRKCLFTGDYARYVDPLTGHPYKNQKIFSILRSVYSIHLDEVLNQNQT